VQKGGFIVIKLLLCAPIHFYRKVVSPLLPRSCRFYPSCSSYALSALKTHGLIRGGAMAAWRLVRCNPWNPGGVDYVPAKKGFERHVSGEEKVSNELV
jgi:putative membrane protein insertion efficiency factor